LKKIIIVILLILSGFLFLFVFNKEEIKIYLPKKFSFIAKYVPEEILILKNMIPGNRWIKHYKMDYNVKFLPETQFLNLNLKTTREIDFISKNWFYPFYIEIFKNVIIIIDTKGKMGSIDISNFDINKIKNLEVKKIKNNIKVDNVLSSLVIDDEIYISVVIFKNDCQYLKVMKAKINLDKINFKKVHFFEECGKSVQAGKMQKYSIDNNNGILITTGDNVYDYPSNKPQDDSSVFGKVLFINLQNGQIKQISKGHRNAMGLYADKDIILATEHGPRGGDEINKIKLDGNYGWPVASYGDPYGLNPKAKKYLDNHNKNGYVEPIFSFVPSIGIAGIIKIDNNFSPKWKDNFIISSLNGRSLFRIKFNENFSKIIYYEKIYIGQRVRDLKYIKSKNLIITTLNDKKEIGFIVPK
jgi:hypothetical protein